MSWIKKKIDGESDGYIDGNTVEFIDILADKINKSSNAVADYYLKRLEVKLGRQFKK